MNNETKWFCANSDHFAEDLRYVKKTMILKGCRESFVEKKWKVIKKIENAPNNSGDDKVDEVIK